MALGRCRKCDRIASTAASHCPHCGARKPIREPLGPLHRLAVAFSATAMLLALAEATELRTGFDPGRMLNALSFGLIGNDGQEQNAERRFSTTAAIAADLKQSLENADTLVWEKILADDAARVVCLEYRIKNDLGEYHRDYRSYIDGHGNETPEHWNRHCAGKQLNDMMHVKAAV